MGYNYYAILGLTRSAADYDIKLAFRQKVIHYNPERNDDENLKPMFTLICEAYEVLSNKFRKAIYDQYGEEGLKTGVMTPLGYVPPYEYDRNTKRTYLNFFGTDSPYADLLNNYRPPVKTDQPADSKVIVPDKQKNKPKDEIHDLKKEHQVFISLEELQQGCLKLLSVPIKELNPCSDDITVVESHRILHLHIKPGLPEHSVFQFPPGPNEYPARASDVFVVTKDKPHPMFWREGVDLHMKKTATMKEALTGFSFTVNTLDGRILHIPITDLITCNQSTKVIKSEGMPRVEAPHRRGDLVIHLSVDYPKTLSPDLRKVLFNLLDAESGNKNTTRAILESKIHSKSGILDFD